MNMFDASIFLRLLAIPVLLLSLISCATTGMTGFHSVEPKNSLPFIEKERIAQTHSILILPFYRDDAGWQKTSFNVLSSSSQLSLIQPQQYEMFIQGPKKNLSQLTPEERPPVVSAIGMAFDADAVLNGMIISRGDGQEIVLQLISSPDSRVIWWQAVDVHSEKPSPDERKTLLTKILSPLMDHLARTERPKQMSQEHTKKQRPEASRPESITGTDTPARTDSQHGNGQKQRPDRKIEKKPRVPAPDDVSPM